MGAYALPYTVNRHRDTNRAGSGLQTEPISLCRTVQWVIAGEIENIKGMVPVANLNPQRVVL